MTPSPSPLPLEEWTHALHRGLGRVVLDVERHGVRDGMIDALLDACIHCKFATPFAENPRSEWLTDLAHRMHVLDRVFDEVENAARAESEFLTGSDQLEASQQSRRQRREILRILADQDETRAVQALRDTMLLDDVNPTRPFGARELEELDPEFVLLQTLRLIGRSGQIPLSWSWQNLAQSFDLDHGEGSADRLLAEAAETDAEIEKLCERLREADPSPAPSTTHRDSFRRSTAQPSLHELIHQPDDYVEVRRLKGAGKKASESDLASLIQEFRISDSSLVQIRCLVALTPRVKDSEEVASLLPEVLDLLNHEDPELAEAAQEFLTPIRAPEVRALAVEWIGNRRWSDRPFRLLTSNQEPGDEELLFDCLDSLRTDDSLSLYGLATLLDDLAPFVNASSPPNQEKLLLAIYELMPCADKRHQVIRRLHARGSVPGPIREEMQFDSDPRTRELVEGNSDQSAEPPDDAQS